MLEGLITGAVAERLGGTGYVCNTYRGLKPHPINIVQMFNFCDDICRRIVHSLLAELCLSDGGTSSPTKQLEDACDTGSRQNEKTLSASVIDSVSMDESGNGNIDTVTDVDPSPKLCKSVKAGERAPLEAIKNWKENGFSSSRLGCLEHCERTLTTFILFSSICDLSPVSPD